MRFRGWGVSEQMEKAKETLKQGEAVMNMMHEWIASGMPGEFVFSPPDNNRISVGTVEELHEVRSILRRLYGWQDEISQKFCSGGEYIGCYAPEASVQLPVPFELWFECPVIDVPEEMLGPCRLEAVDTSVEHSVVCPVGGE